MNGSIRRDIVFSEHASVALFECLIVAGAPATGLLQDTAFRDCGTLQMTLQLLRDMWRKADTLYVPRADLDSLHRMECNTMACHKTPIPDQITLEARKLSRYYIYLLFRYCISSAAPMTHNQWGVMSNRLICTSQWEPRKNVASLVDIPGSWLETKVCTNYPSAPPMPEGNFSIGFKNYLPQQQQQQPQQLPQCVEHEQYPTQQQPQQLPQHVEHQHYPTQQQQPQQHEPQKLAQHAEHQRYPMQQQQPPHQIQQYHREMDFTKQQDPRLLLYPELTDHHHTGLSKPFKGPDKKPRTKNVFRKGCYDSNVDSGRAALKTVSTAAAATNTGLGAMNRYKVSRFVPGQAFSQRELVEFERQRSVYRMAHVKAQSETSLVIQRNRYMECLVCLEVVLGKDNPKERRFGILSNCKHCFCLQCIRAWRSDKRHGNIRQVQLCPVCQIPSQFYIPNDYWVEDKEEKQELVQKYKNFIATIPCRYFDQGRGTCHFGSKCFYKHSDWVGAQTPKRQPLRRKRRLFPEEISPNRQTLMGEDVYPFTMTEMSHVEDR